MAKIELNNVSKKIGKNVVLSNISVSMHSGKIYGFQGVNGSGKTMLMRIIIGLIKPTEGNVVINGKVLGKDIEFPENIGFLLENPAFLDTYSGFNNLKMLTSIQGELSDEKIMEVLKSVGLEDAATKKYKKYSLGMKQRLGIAAAVMENPEIVIVDEPTNALDTSGIEMVKKLLKEQKERGALVIVSCHDTQTLMELSDEVIKLNVGRICGHLYSDEGAEGGIESEK